ncbi:bifunctional riboflavin kinase/FAD synthetase [Actinopolymorpha alba]|uniref:bifunctional riboflavin kinase/FAD synthetase n=1 Tax=Actinopolymorpha alba TaxID=533267 RepID=UPI0003767F9C|nr:bifunctional riboflavin kinase/FAD synthetase [Actinopolymorpha alba]
MQRWRDLSEVPRGIGPTVVTIGVFDGVHRGHQRVIGRTVELARERGARAVVVTFDPHPAAVVRPDAVPPLLATLDRRIELFEEYAADAVVVIPFDKERSREAAEDFVRELADSLAPVAIVVGDDFRFGFKAAGDVALLRRLGAELGFQVEGLARQDGPARESSSTAVRQRLENGDVAEARALLGHTFRVDGEVVEGAHRGRELGFPTANVPAAAGMALTADGVYAGWLRVVGPGRREPRLPAAISVGTNPQFGQEPRRVESYVLDRDDLELYGLNVAVEFVDRVRGQERFDSVDALVHQMHDDVERVREILAADEQAG